MAVQSLSGPSLSYVQTRQTEPLPPPNLVRGPIAWARQNMFSSIPNTILTLCVLYGLYVLVPPL
ncbi:MAG: amino acid transporter permease, partial [Enterovirga sp.]|nr:amino acid transporter permease [Enterovirga sp.]